MRITILGAGAMGCLFGSYLSKKDDVFLVDVDPECVESISQHGVQIVEQDGESWTAHPKAVLNSQGLGRMDLVIVFVKSMYTITALEANRGLIGPETYVMTLQNGAGHESKLLQFADREHVIIGTTQHNSSLLGNGHVRHGGSGRTSIGLLGGDSERIRPIADTLTACGFACSISDGVARQIWSKLFLNSAASTLTGILQAPLGFILENPHACDLMERLAREAVATANALGVGPFETERVIEEIKQVLANARMGYTSIYADLQQGNRTEVDTIAGSVVAAAKEAGVPVPYHEMAVALVHAMEERKQWK